MKKYDIIIAGAGASGVFMSYELTKLSHQASVLMLDKGAPLEKRVCPIKTGKTKTCVKCSPCHIMNGYGGAGTLSDGKYNITTQFGGDLHKYVGVDEAMELMEYVDSVLCSMGGSEAKLYSTADSDLKTRCLQNNLHLLEAKVRHLGTDRNIQILGRISRIELIPSFIRLLKMWNIPKTVALWCARTKAILLVTSWSWRRDVPAPNGFPLYVIKWELSRKRTGSISVCV